MQKFIFIILIFSMISCGKDKENCKDFKSVWTGDNGVIISLTNLQFNTTNILEFTNQESQTGKIFKCNLYLTFLGDESSGRLSVDYQQDLNLGLTNNQQYICEQLEGVAPYTKECNAIKVCENSECVTYL